MARQHMLGIPRDNLMQLTHICVEPLAANWEKQWKKNKIYSALAQSSWKDLMDYMIKIYKVSASIQAVVWQKEPLVVDVYVCGEC